MEIVGGTLIFYIIANGSSEKKVGKHWVRGVFDVEFGKNHNLDAYPTHHIVL